MKITVINGTEKHGVTYRLKEIFLSEFKEKADITEYYLPKDFKGEHTKVKFLFCRLIQKSLHKAAPEYLDGNIGLNRVGSAASDRRREPMNL
jgi:hypothetical protein